jgi:hypothetical protein
MDFGRKLGLTNKKGKLRIGIGLSMERKEGKYDENHSRI